jgi:hypothetical protein
MRIYQILFSTGMAASCLRSITVLRFTVDAFRFFRASIVFIHYAAEHALNILISFVASRIEVSTYHLSLLIYVETPRTLCRLTIIAHCLLFRCELAGGHRLAPVWQKASRSKPAGDWDSQRVVGVRFCSVPCYPGVFCDL